MHGSKLVSILKLFDQNELKQFEKFVKSPFFSSGRDVKGLFSIFKNAYPEFSSSAILRTNIHSKLFKKEKFNERRVKNLTASLTRMAESFLVHNKVALNKTEYKTKLAEIFFQKGSEKLFLSSLRTDDKDNVCISLTDPDNCYNEYKLLRLKEKYFISKNRFVEAIPYRVNYTENLLLHQYIACFKRLKDKEIFPIFYNTPFAGSLFDSVIENTDFDALLASLDNRNYALKWLLEIYYCIYKAIQLNKDIQSEKYYFRLKEIFFAHLNEFTIGEKCYIFDAMATYCMMRDSINDHFSRECFEVYKNMLKENAFKYNPNEYMSTTLYGNIIFWAYDLEEYDWLEKFISKYSDDLRPENKDDLVNLAKAHLYFGKKDFLNSLHSIDKVRNEFLLYKIQVRNLKFKLYFELNFIEEAYKLIDSFRHFLKENTEINEIFKERAIDFIGIYVKLLNGKSDTSAIDFESLRARIDNMQGYELRPWMLSKLNELVKKR